MVPFHGHPFREAEEGRHATTSTYMFTGLSVRQLSHKHQIHPYLEALIAYHVPIRRRCAIENAGLLFAFHQAESRFPNRLLSTSIPNTSDSDEGTRGPSEKLLGCVRQGLAGALVAPGIKNGQCGPEI